MSEPAELAEQPEGISTRPADPVVVRSAVVDLALGDAPTAARVAAALAPEEWSQVVELSWAWRVTPQVAAAVHASGQAVPAATLTRLRHLSMASAAQSALVLRRAVEAAETLRSAGVAVAAFKGVAALVSVHGSAAARMVGDVDLLVSVDDADRAVDVLVDERFAVARTGEDEQQAQGGPLALRNDYAVLRDADGVELDLHWRLGAHPPPPMEAAHLLRRAVTDGPLPVVAPTDAILLTCHHAVRSRLDPATTVKDVADLVAWADAADRWDPAELQERAREASLGGPVLALWQAAASRHPSAPAAGVVDQLLRGAPRRERRDAAALVELFDRQITEGNLSLGLLTALSFPSRAPTILLADRRRAARRAQPADNAGVDRPGTARRARFRAGGTPLVRVVRDARRSRLAGYRALVKAQRAFR